MFRAFVMDVPWYAFPGATHCKLVLQAHCEPMPMAVRVQMDLPALVSANSAHNRVLSSYSVSRLQLHACTGCKYGIRSALRKSRMAASNVPADDKAGILSHSIGLRHNDSTSNAVKNRFGAIAARSGWVGVACCWERQSSRQLTGQRVLGSPTRRKVSQMPSHPHAPSSTLFKPNRQRAQLHLAQRLAF